jgi:putative membrane protein
VFLLVVVYLLFGRKGLKSPGHYPDRDPLERTHLESPVDILKRRYAEGQITKEEFEQMKKDLSS